MIHKSICTTINKWVDTESTGKKKNPQFQGNKKALEGNIDAAVGVSIIPFFLPAVGPSDQTSLRIPDSLLYLKFSLSFPIPRESQSSNLHRSANTIKNSPKKTITKKQ